MEHKNYNAIHKSVRKKDSMQLLLGKPVYTDDITGPALVVKLLRSPHANAIVEEIHTEIAKKIPGVVDIYTWEDVPKTRFAIAGQTYPEPSPYDRLIIDRHVRFVGDVVAIIAAEDEKAACKAMKLVKVKYNVLEPVLDFHKAKDNPVLVHPEDDWYPPVDVGGDAKRNVIAHELSGDGDVDAVISDCEVSFSHAYHMRAFNQAMMEFGALQCVPKSPDCECCPLNGKCLGLAARRVERLPVKSGKTVVKPRYFNYLYIHGQGMTLLSKRTGNDIWRNLYEFPLIETERAVTWEELSGMAVFQELFDGIEKVEITREYVAKKHVLSHRVIYPVFYEIRVDSFSECMGKYLKVPDNRVGEYAVSRLIQSYLEVRDGLLF